jgi:hypothetical protein
VRLEKLSENRWNAFCTKELVASKTHFR